MKVNNVIIRMPAGLTGAKCSWIDDRAGDHREPRALVVNHQGTVKAVCDQCLWHYCETCDYDGHQCPDCGTVADHWCTPCSDHPEKRKAENAAQVAVIDDLLQTLVTKGRHDTIIVTREAYDLILAWAIDRPDGWLDPDAVTRGYINRDTRLVISP